MMRVFLILVITISFFSCSKRNNNRADKYQLEQDRSIGFPMDDQTSYKTFFVGTFKDSVESFLVFLSQRKPSIQFFDISNQKLVKEIKLEKEGPQGVGSPTGLLVLSWDSIYVTSSSQYKVSLINAKGDLLKSYRLLEGSSYNENTGMLRPYTISPPIKINNSIYFNVAPDRDVYKPSYFEGATNLSLNLENGEFKYFNKYPEEFKNGVWGVAAVSYSTAYNPSSKKFIYSFAISDSINVFDPNSGSSKRYFAGSKFISSALAPMTNPDNDHDLEYALETPYYGAIAYDKFRHVYYRFVKLSVSYKDNNGQINAFHEKPISVIVLDEAMNVIGETKLPDNIFLDHIFFITEQGLFISNGNPENPSLKEDLAEFTCFKISPLS